MQIALAVFALMILVLSPAMATEEITLEAAQPELSPSMNDLVVPNEPRAEAAAPQPQNLTDSRDIDLPTEEALISVGPTGELQPN